MTMNDLKSQLKREEGVIPYAYADSLGYLTIGVGRLVDKRKGGRLRPIEIEFLLDNDIAEITAGIAKVLPWFAALSEPRQAVLQQMAFQMGLAGLLGFSRTLDAVRDQHYDHAAELLLQSKWATQTPSRAKRLSLQLASGAWQ